MKRKVEAWRFIYSYGNGKSKYSAELECGHIHDENTMNEDSLPDSVWCYKCEDLQPRRKLIVSG